MNRIAVGLAAVVTLGICAIGAAVLAGCAWSWRGGSPRARWWVRSLSGRQLLLAVAPGLGLLVFGGGLMTAAAGLPEVAAGLVVLVLAVPMLAGFTLVLAGIVGALPRWWGPKWYREKLRTERRPPTWTGF